MQQKILNLRLSLIAALVMAMALFTSARWARSDDSATTQPSDLAHSNNLALNKPASASSIESDDHAAEKANDSDDGDDSRWCADDGTTPQWWQVDLAKPSTLTGCRIKWEFDGKQYHYIVEGSPDGAAWKTLSDQSKSTVKTQVQALTFSPPAEGIRYLRIRVTGLEDGSWASIFDVKVFGQQ